MVSTEILRNFKIKMPGVCCIKNCSTVKKRNSITLFKFPATDSNMCLKWLNACQGRITHGNSNRNKLYICAQHFEKDYFIEGAITVLRDGIEVQFPRKKQTLKKGAIPSIFPELIDTSIVDTGKTIFGNSSHPFKQTATSNKKKHNEGALLKNEKTLQWISSLKNDQKTEMKEMLFPNEINAAKFLKVPYETASQMPPSHQNENETPPEMKHSPITDWNSLPWVCYLCEENFNGFENLSTHQESFHKDRYKEGDHFICFDCKETLSEYSIFLNHIRRRHYNSLKLCCDACNKVLPDYTHLAEHREEHIEFTNEIHPNVYHCNLCEEVAATERILKLHTQECHDLKPGDATKQNHLSDVFVIEEVKYECPDDLEDQSVVENCVKCEEEYNDTEELFQCGQCVQNFKTEASFMDHLTNHRSGQPFDCIVQKRLERSYT